MTEYFFQKYTFLDFLAEFGTGLILLAPTVHIPIHHVVPSTLCMSGEIQWHDKQAQHTYISSPHPWHPLVHYVPTNTSRRQNVQTYVPNEEPFLATTEKCYKYQKP
jgi:hypothetical protein